MGHSPAEAGAPRRRSVGCAGFSRRVSRNDPALKSTAVRRSLGTSQREGHEGVGQNPAAMAAAQRLPIAGNHPLIDADKRMAALVCMAMSKSRFRNKWCRRNP
jgi:prophage maintenance system killer protein